MKEFELKNNIKSVYKNNKNTPRVGFSLNISINNAEDLSGTYCLLSRLLLQGTTNRSSEQLAKELDENAIDFCCDMKQDFLRFRFTCLNEDFNLAVEFIYDIVKNSNFDEIEKEKAKMRGEITAELDSKRVLALDNYYKTLFKGHYYGHTYTTMIDNIDKISKESIVKAYKNIIESGKKVIALVGDIDFDKAIQILNNNIGDLPNVQNVTKNISTPVCIGNETVEIVKNDAQQAQIIQGWIVPTFDNKDYPALILLNIILGAAGLSSRLFLEIREKKGLAYHVRTSYESNEKCANFSIYIATEPKNVQTCLDGFKIEIEKLKQTLVSVTELKNARNNFLGKQQFCTETNSQQANQLAHHGLMGLGFNFEEHIIKETDNVTPEQIKECVNKYFNENYVVSILHP